MDDYYGNPARVMLDGSIQPVDLGLTTTEELTLAITDYLIDIKSLIDADRGRDLLIEFGSLEDVPRCIHMVANSAAIQLAKQAKLNRESPVIKVDDYTIRMVPNTVLTPTDKENLRKCVKKQLSMNMIVANNTLDEDPLNEGPADESDDWWDE